jgi:hypothetical protein
MRAYWADKATLCEGARIGVFAIACPRQSDFLSRSAAPGTAQSPAFGSRHDFDSSGSALMLALSISASRISWCWSASKSKPSSSMSRSGRSSTIRPAAAQDRQRSLHRRAHDVRTYRGRNFLAVPLGRERESETHGWLIPQFPDRIHRKESSSEFSMSQSLPRDTFTIIPRFGLRVGPRPSGNPCANGGRRNLP